MKIETSSLSNPLLSEPASSSPQNASHTEKKTTILGSAFKAVATSPTAQSFAQALVKNVATSTLGKAAAHATGALRQENIKRASSNTDSTASLSENSDHSSVETTNDLIPTELAHYQLQEEDQTKPLTDWRRYTDIPSDKKKVVTPSDHSPQNLGAPLLSGVNSETGDPYARKQKSYDDYR